MDSIDRLLGFLAHVAQGNQAAAEAAMHPDFFVNEVASFPYGGVYHGAEGWWRLAMRVNAHWRFDTIELEEALAPADGEKVCLLVRIKGACRHNGRSLDTRVAEIWSLKDNLLLSVEPFFWDTAEMVAMLADDAEEASLPAANAGFAAVRFLAGPRLADRWASARGA